MNYLRVFFPVLFLVFCTKLTTHSLADVIVTAAANAPNTQIIASYDPNSDTNAYVWRWIGNDGLSRVDVGQSFLAPAGNNLLMDRITLRAREFGTAIQGQSYSLEIWQFANSADNSGDNLISTQTGTLPSGLTAPAYWTFAIDDVLLQSNSHYGFILSFDAGPDPNRFVNFTQDFVGGYVDGQRVQRNGTPPTWGTNSGRDLTFYVQGITAVPEPSSSALALVCMASITWRLRRNEK